MRDRRNRPRRPRLTGAARVWRARASDRAVGVFSASVLGSTADRVRGEATRIAGAQSGLVTEGQLARPFGLPAAQHGLRLMERCGEVELVCAGVWVHAATGKTPLADAVLEAQARWLALAPRLLLRERTAMTSPTELLPVIGGGAAWEHWGFGPTTWLPALYLPRDGARIESDEIVEIRVDVIDPVDVVWAGQFPYLRPEPTLALAYAETGDLDAVAAALRDGMWRLSSLQRELLAYHLAVVAERAGWAEDGWTGERIYQRLLSMTGPWPTRPVTDWWPNAAHAERVRREHPAWLRGDRLIDWWGKNAATIAAAEHGGP